jgi:hypothetical protein
LPKTRNEYFVCDGIGMDLYGPFRFKITARLVLWFQRRRAGEYLQICAYPVTDLPVFDE